jgi:putative membrane protein
MRLALIGTLLAATALGACHKTGTNAGQDVSNPGNSAPVNTVQDVAATGVGVASAITHGTTASAFVPAAAMADMYEIEAGKIAVQRAKDPKVKAFGQMMIKDHTASSDKMKATLANAGVAVTPPAALDERRKGMLDNLKAAGDADFDLAYLHQQLAAHTEALTLHKEYSTAGDNAALKAVAAATVPVVEMHLSQIKDIGGEKLKAMGPG